MKPPISTTEYKETVFVYLAPLPGNAPVAPVYPLLRWQQISECKSERVRKEKHSVWKLLEYAIRDRYGKELNELQFTYTDGKWDCDLCRFSLSHSHGALCVAVSDSPVGVDLEKITQPSDALSKKILSAEELERYHGMPKSEKSNFFTRIWTRKESLFKRVGGKGFFTAEANGYSQEERVCLNGEEYVLSVATESTATVQIQRVTLPCPSS